MVNRNGETTARKGIGLLPFFHNQQTYRGIGLIAGIDKQRKQSVILTAIIDQYPVLMKSDIATNDADVLHECLVAGSKKCKTQNVADFIELCCEKYIEKRLAEFKPKSRGYAL